MPRCRKDTSRHLGGVVEASGCGLFIFQLEKPRRFVAIPVSDMRPADDGLPAFGVTTFASVRAAALPGDGFDGEAFIDASDAAPGDPIGFGIASVISDAQVGVARGA